jgi:ActR/RegA family two-component response regulator
MSENSGHTPIHLLIIATNPKGLQTAQRYLERRDVICSVVRSVKEALGYITNHKPNFVMLSWNLEGVNPIKIQQVISQSFNVKVILFAERGDTSTSIQLNNSGAPTLQMPINGPKILIKLQTIIREASELTAGAEKEKTRHGGSSMIGSSEKGAAGASPLHVAGHAKNDQTIIMKGSAGSKDGTFIGNASISNSGTWNGAEDGEKNAGTFISNNPNKSTDGTFSGNSGGPSGSGSSDYPRGEKDDDNGPSGRAVGSQGFHSQEGSFNGTGESGSLPANMAGAAEKKNRTFQGSGETNHTPDDIADKPSSRGPQQKVPSALSSSKETVIKGSQAGSVLADGVKTVVRDLSRPTTEVAKPLESTRQISVLTVSSPRFHGYLVAAHGPNKKIDEEFTKQLKAKLSEHLNQQGETLDQVGADFEMEIQKVEFGAWAEEHADFLALSQHQDSEIAVAFVGGEDSLAKFEASSEDMMSCQLQNFAVGEPVQCDMFVHLQKNDKFVRYLKEGVPLTQDQKDRLLKKQVKDLHFGKSDLSKYKEYVGKSFIRNKLGESKVFVKKVATNKAS